MLVESFSICIRMYLLGRRPLLNSHDKIKKVDTMQPGLGHETVDIPSISHPIPKPIKRLTDSKPKTQTPYGTR